jgi:hypothetical protein
MSKAQIVHVLSPNITPEQARDDRAHAWAFVFRCYDSKKNPAAGQSVRGDSDGTETKEDSACAGIIPRA